MNKSKTSHLTGARERGVSLFASVLVALFLFYIDEGYYSFAWVLSTGAWIIFTIHVIGLFGGQQIILKLMPVRYPDKQRRIISLVLGIPPGLTALFVIFSGSIGK